PSRAPLPAKKNPRAKFRVVRKPMAGSRKQPTLPATGRILAEVIDRRPTELRRQRLGRFRADPREVAPKSQTAAPTSWAFAAKDNISTTLVVVSNPNPLR